MKKEIWKISLKEYVKNNESSAENAAEISRRFINKVASRQIDDANKLQSELNKKLRNKKITDEEYKKGLQKVEKIYAWINTNKILDLINIHEKAVKKALKEGKFLSEEVLKDYPKLNNFLYNKEKERNKKMELKLNMLQRAAKELNEVLGLEPEIKLNQPISELTKQIKEATELIMEGDIFSKDVRKTMHNLGYWKMLSGDEKAPEKKKIEKKKIEKKEKKKVDLKIVKDADEKPIVEVKDVDETEKKIASRMKGQEKKEKKSNKERIYLLWRDKNIENAKELYKINKERVKINTIRTWINQWKKNKNLPSGYKK